MRSIIKRYDDNHLNDQPKVAMLLLPAMVSLGAEESIKPLLLMEKAIASVDAGSISDTTTSSLSPGHSTPL